MACATTETYDYSKEPDPRKHDFMVGPADALKITVWKNAELSTETRVRPDGTITLPLVGDLVAAGRTTQQLRDEISKKLSTYVRDENATVTVAVVDVSSYRFTVSGNVEHAGIFTSRYYVTVAEAIAQAGGPNRYADPERVLLLRTDDKGQVRRIPVNYEAIRTGKNLDANIAILAGDIVLVQ
jgi:polysaccharide export outer membrane protein